ncbi:uncharacterized protein AB9X84_025663 [Acanthopagrus schlegelii]
MPSCLRRWSMSAQMVWLPHCITALLQGIPHPQHSVENFKEEDVMLRMGFGDDVAAVDAASSSHFVPLSAMMRNHKVSDRPVPGESRGPEDCLTRHQRSVLWSTTKGDAQKGGFVNGRRDVCQLTDQRAVGPLQMHPEAPLHPIPRQQQQQHPPPPPPLPPPSLPPSLPPGHHPSPPDE